MNRVERIFYQLASWLEFDAAATLCDRPFYSLRFVRIHLYTLTSTSTRLCITRRGHKIYQAEIGRCDALVVLKYA